MTDNAKMVDLPWVDGTTRTVPEGTAYASLAGLVYAARDGGYSDGINPNTPWSEPIRPHFSGSVAVHIFTEAPEPPVKVEVPTIFGAVVSTSVYPNEPGYVLTRCGWIGLRTCIEHDPSQIATEIHDGARVLFEGVDEDTP